MAVSDLLQAAALLLVLAVLALPGDDFSGSDLWRALRESLCSLSATMAVAAVLGAALLWRLPTMAASGLGGLTLAELNDRIALAHLWLQRAWLLPFALGLCLLGLALAGFAAVGGVRARRLGSSLGWALKLKALAALLACFGVTAAGLQHRAQAQHDDASTLRQALPALRMALADVATRQAAAVLAEAMVDGTPAATALLPTARAYWVVQPYLPLPGWPVDWRQATALVRPTALALPDVSTDQLQLTATSMRRQHGLGTSDTQRLAAVLVEATVDPAVAEPARQALLEIKNPLIDELVAALLDPVVARPLRQWVIELAVAGVAASGDGAAMRRWAKQRWAQAPPAVTQRLQRALRRASAPPAMPPSALGQPAWHAVRVAMRASVDQSLGGREPVSGLDALSAQRAIARFETLWASLGMLLQTPQARISGAEAAAARYLLTAQDRGHEAAVYAALFGATVARQMPTALFRATGLVAAQPTARDGLMLYFSHQPVALRVEAAQHYPAAATTPAEMLAEHARAGRGWAHTGRQTGKSPAARSARGK